jgi:hypothetical protein|tara:strand:+ start:309 stop:494 length:186 start_codon:yes stop_codon:yes gene_type:complete
MAKKNKKKIVGYYYDGKDSYNLYEDENGNKTQEKVEDKSKGDYGDYSGINHDKLLHDRFYK